MHKTRAALMRRCPAAFSFGQEKMPRITREIVGAQGDLRQAFLVDDALAHAFKIARASN